VLRVTPYIMNSPSGGGGGSAGASRHQAGGSDQTAALLVVGAAMDRKTNSQPRFTARRFSPAVAPPKHCRMLRAANRSLALRRASCSAAAAHWRDCSASLRTTSSSDVDHSSHPVMQMLTDTRTFTAEDVRAFAQLTGEPASPPRTAACYNGLFRPQISYRRAHAGCTCFFSGDDNPLHDDASFASSERFSAPVVHGMLYACMFGAIVGVRFPGAVYVSQTLNFRKPVYLGDAVTATLELRHSGVSGRLLNFDTRATNQSGDVVLEGEARVLLPRSARLRPSSGPA